jgi:hypothetical protein
MKRSAKTKKTKISRKCRGPIVGVRTYQAMSGPSAFEVWVDGKSVFCGMDMRAPELIKLLREIGVSLDLKNVKDRPNHDISDW